MTTNPKDLIGATKVPLSLLPAAGVAHGAMAMADGKRKYGAYNFRRTEVIASVYVDAIKRHIDLWNDARQELTSDSKVHHLGAVIADAAILLDTQMNGKLIDDRPQASNLAELLDKLSAQLKAAEAAKTVASDILLEPDPENIRAAHENDGGGPVERRWNNTQKSALRRAERGGP